MSGHRQLLGIYDADGGVLGELRYVVGHLRGTAECALCDITHSPVRRKRAWDRLVADLNLDIEVVHRNELPAWAREPAAQVTLPAVLGRRADGTVEVVLDRGELAACAGSVEAFRERLTRALAPEAP